MIVSIDESNGASARAFLERHFDSSLLLLDNLATHGPHLGEHGNSGDFRAVVENGAVAAVFCLTRRGNLLVQAGGRRDLSQQILDACAHGSPPIRAVVGEFRAADALWQELAQRTDFRPGATFKEVLYSAPLTESAAATSAHPVRLAEPTDFERWDELMQAFRSEEGIPTQSSREGRRSGFFEACAKGRYWAGLADGTIVSTATVFAVAAGAGQIGGVYTAPEHRRRGLSRAVLSELMRDSRSRLGLTRLILFTPSGNTAARTLYESLGFTQVGEFALFFSQT